MNRLRILFTGPEQGPETMGIPLYATRIVRGLRDAAASVAHEAWGKSLLGADRLPHT